MRLSVKTRIVLLCCLSAGIFFSCKTQNSAVNQTPEKPPVVKQETPPAFSRLAFGETLEKLITAGKKQEALALFDTVPEPDASDLSIRLLKLSVMLSAGQLDQSATFANELEKEYPQNTDILYVQALLAGTRNDGSGRTQYLNRILQIQPDNSRAMTGLGEDLYARKNYPLAKTWFLKAVAADPSNVDALLGLARVYYMQSELPKAADTLNLAIQKQGNYSVLWAERARVKSESNDLPGALSDIEMAVKLNPGIYSHWTDYGTYLISSAKKEEARAAFSRAIKLEPDSYLAYIYRAGLNDDLGYTDEAISDYQAICRLYPQYYYAAEGLGILLWGKGDYAGSAQAFRQALSGNPGNTSYALMLTLCDYRLNKIEEARTFMGKYITTLDNSSTEYFLCRLFVDRSGDAEVLDRVMKEANVNVRNRMLFYMAMYYEISRNNAIAQKYYIEITSIPTPAFFEYRLSQWALKSMNASGTGETGGQTNVKG